MILLFGFTLALSTSLVLTYWVRAAAVKWRFVDRPDGTRKSHAEPTPSVGGAAIFLSASLVLGLGFLVRLPEFSWARSQGLMILALSGGAGAVFALGLWDDIRGLNAWTRFGVEIAVAVGLTLAGIRIDSFGLAGETLVQVPILLSIPLTVFWIVGITNSFNLLDGGDGVAGGAALFALLTMGGVSLLFGKEAAAAACFVLAGATLGFLFFNFPPASIFLGDSGSLFLGFSLASIGVIATQKAPTVLAVAIPVVAFGLPIMDTALAIVRRFLRRERIFKPDRGHIHHRLMDLGHSPRVVVSVVYLLTAVLCTFSLLLAGGQGTLTAFGFIVVGTVMVLFLQRLRIPELMELGKIVHWGRLQRLVIERNMRVREAGEVLRRVETARGFIDALAAAFSGGEFSSVELWLARGFGDSLSSEPEVEARGAGEFLRLEFAVEDPGRIMEIRLPLITASGEQRGRLSLYRPIDGMRIMTDLGVVSGDLQPAVVEVLSRWSLKSAGAPIPHGPERSSHLSMPTSD